MKLHNKSQRTIQGTINGREYAFKPDAALDFPDAEGEKLRRLYPGEVVSMDDVKKAFDEPADVAGEAPPEPSESKGKKGKGKFEAAE